MGAIDTLRDVAGNPSQVAEAWKADGKKVAGYRCIYVPEEIITAAGMLPFPLYGTPEPVRLADSYFQSCTCEMVRNLFDLALDGKFAFLDVLALANTCDVVRRMCDIWDRYIEDIPVYMINNPQRLVQEGNRDYWLEELRRFRSRMAEVAGVEITDDAVSAAIRAHNSSRDLLKEIFSLRRADPPPMTGEEAWAIGTAATILPPEQLNPLLEQTLDELKARDVPDNDGPRIMITGSVLHHPALVRMVEEEGGVVVADDLCNTTRYFWDRVEEDGDPLEAIYHRHNARPMCACMHPMESRRDFVNDLADEFDVEAVIYFNIKYCHPFLYEAPLFKKALEKREIPTNVLEVGHDMSGHGQLRTRIQAFIEMLEL